MSLDNYTLKHINYAAHHFHDENPTNITAVWDKSVNDISNKSTTKTKQLNNDLLSDTSLYGYVGDGYQSCNVVWKTRICQDVIINDHTVREINKNRKNHAKVSTNSLELVMYVQIVEILKYDITPDMQEDIDNTLREHEKRKKIPVEFYKTVEFRLESYNESHFPNQQTIIESEGVCVKINPYKLSKFIDFNKPENKDVHTVIMEVCQNAFFVNDKQFNKYLKLDKMLNDNDRIFASYRKNHELNINMIDIKRERDEIKNKIETTCIANILDGIEDQTLFRITYESEPKIDNRTIFEKICGKKFIKKPTDHISYIVNNIENFDIESNTSPIIGYKFKHLEQLKASTVSARESIKCGMLDRECSCSQNHHKFGDVVIKPMSSYEVVHMIMIIKMLMNQQTKGVKIIKEKSIKRKTNAMNESEMKEILDDWLEFKNTHDLKSKKKKNTYRSLTKHQRIFATSKNGETSDMVKIIQELTLSEKTSKDVVVSVERKNRSAISPVMEHATFTK